MKTKKPVIHQMTMAQFKTQFPNDDACKVYLIEHRWPDGIRCPRCGNENVHEHARAFHWQCYQCTPNGGYRFSVLVGTIFENTNMPLTDWFRVIHFMMTSKKGMSALQIQRMMGFGSYRTAWSMCHKVRAGLQDQEFSKLLGIVEVDETFVGGKAKNRHKDKRGGGDGTGGVGSGKSIVGGAVQRKGNVIARVLENVNGETLSRFVSESVSDKVSLLCTDQWRGYSRLNKKYPHATIDHSAGQYVVGAIHTNTIEGFWSLFKRGMMGSYHKISKKYLSLYVAEFQFRYNNRLNDDIFGAAIAAC